MLYNNNQSIEDPKHQSLHQSHVLVATRISDLLKDCLKHLLGSILMYTPTILQNQKHNVFRIQ